MRGKILIMLLLAVVCGGASLVLARSWVAGRTSEMAASAADKPAVEFSTIVVAAEPLRFGAPLSAKNLKTIPWPAADLPPGAFATVEDLTTGEPRTVLQPMEASEPVLAAKVTGPGERAGLSRLIEEGRRAVTIRVNEVAGVAGFVLPGDRVDIVLIKEGDGVSQSDVILQGVKVLTIDQIADQRAEEPMVARAVTVETDPAGAQKIALAQNIGAIALTLRPSGDVTPADVTTITANDFGSSTGPVVAEAAAPAVPAAAPEPAKPASVTIAVTRALESTEYKVLAQPVAAVADREEAPRLLPASAPLARPAPAIAPPASLRSPPSRTVGRHVRIPVPAARPVPMAARDVDVTGSTGPVPAHILDLPALP